MRQTVRQAGGEIGFVGDDRDPVQPGADDDGKRYEPPLGEHHHRTDPCQQAPCLHDADGNAQGIDKVLEREVAPELSRLDTVVGDIQRRDEALLEAAGYYR